MKDIFGSLGARRALAATALVALASLSASAFATESSQTQARETVKYGDLNLAHPEGVAALYQRVAVAAGKVCSSYESSDLTLRGQWRACVRDARSRAIADINIPALSAYAASREERHSPTLAMVDGR
jgi:UrcA family protein